MWAQACGTGCQAADEVADTISHIVGAVQEVGVAKPSLRLVDIELPMGGPGGNITTLGDTNPAPSGRAPLKARQRSKKDLVITGGTKPPTCSHAGLLHDGGTNGPPYP